MSCPRPKVTQRPARPEDAAAVATVMIESRRVLMPFVVSPHGDDEVRQWVQTQLLPTGGVTVALVDQWVVGMLALSVRVPVQGADGASAAWIDQLYVDPTRVGCGVGTALLDTALAELPRPVQLYCFAANRRARHFYEQRGFVAVAFGDGSGNEERCPDVLYRLDPAASP